MAGAYTRTCTKTLQTESWNKLLSHSAWSESLLWRPEAALSLETTTSGRISAEWIFEDSNIEYSISEYSSIRLFDIWKFEYSIFDIRYWSRKSKSKPKPILIPTSISISISINIEYLSFRENSNFRVLEYSSTRMFEYRIFDIRMSDTPYSIFGIEIENRNRNRNQNRYRYRYRRRYWYQYW